MYGHYLETNKNSKVFRFSPHLSKCPQPSPWDLLRWSCTTFALQLDIKGGITSGCINRVRLVGRREPHFFRWSPRCFRFGFCWKKSQGQPHVGWCWNLVDNGDIYHINWWVYRNSEPSTVAWAPGFFTHQLLDFAATEYIWDANHIGDLGCKRSGANLWVELWRENKQKQLGILLGNLVFHLKKLLLLSKYFFHEMREANQFEWPWIHVFTYMWLIFMVNVGIYHTWIPWVMTSVLCKMAEKYVGEIKTVNREKTRWSLERNVQTNDLTWKNTMHLQIDK